MGITDFHLHKGQVCPCQHLLCPGESEGSGVGASLSSATGQWLMMSGRVLLGVLAVWTFMMIETYVNVILSSLRKNGLKCLPCQLWHLISGGDPLTHMPQWAICYH